MIELEEKLKEGFEALIALIEIQMSDAEELKIIINGKQD